MGNEILGNCKLNSKSNSLEIDLAASYTRKRAAPTIERAKNIVVALMNQQTRPTSKSHPITKNNKRKAKQQIV